MSTSIVHIGDFHASPGPRNADRYATLDQIVAEGLQLPRLGAWVWPGDLFDGLSTIEDRNAIDARLTRMAGRAPVVIVEGNHDRRGDLRGFANLAGSWPIVVVDERPHTIGVRLATGQMASIFCLPYPFKAGLVGAGVAHGELVNTAGHLLDPIFLVAAAELEARRRQGEITFCLFHANIAGAVTSAGQPNVGKEIELTHALLDRLGNIYKGGNHIHRPQEIAGAWYAGSTARKDYGETEAKRYLVIDFEADSSYRVTSRSLTIPPLYLVEGTLDRDGFAVAEGVTDDVALRFACRDWAGCDVRVQYRYNASERAIVDEQKVRDPFNTSLRLKVQGIVVPDREVRAGTVSSAKTLADKLAAMRPDGVLPTSVADKVAVLEQQDRDAVIDGVRKWLAPLEQPQTETVAA